MPQTQSTDTPNYAFTKPTPGGDTNVWGDMLNGNWDSVDTLLKALDDKVVALEDQLNNLNIEAFPIGSLYYSETDTDPATTLGYGTWEAYAKGRAIVGADDTVDAEWPAGEERGEATHTLTEAEMPAHTHVADPPNTATDTKGDHAHTYSASSSTATVDVNNPAFPVGTTAVNKTTATAGAHAHNVNIPAFDTGSAGSGAAHNNVQPSVAVYVWRRTA